MKSISSRVLLLFIITLILILFSINSFAAETRVKYYVEGGYITFDPDTRLIMGSEYDVTGARIPSTINGIKVKGITIGYKVNYDWQYAFTCCSKLEWVTLDEGITYIGSRAFLKCKKLTTVTIPKSLTKLENNAFEECISLVTVNGDLPKVEDALFYKCSSLKNVSIGDTVTSIGREAFYYCTSLESIVIPRSVKVIESAAFAGCQSLSKIYYQGTEEEWKLIDKASNAFPSKTEIVFAPEIFVEDTKGHIGDTVTVSVKIKNNSGFAGLNGYLTYSDSLILKDVKNKTDLTFTNDASMVWDGVSNYTQNGDLMMLVFEISETAEAGDHFVKFNFVEAYDADFNEVDFISVGGKVVVSDFVYGDVNGDGDINTKDIILLRRFVASKDPITGESNVEISKGSDCDGDGNINTKDIILLRKYVAGKDPVTGESTEILGPKS